MTGECPERRMPQAGPRPAGRLSLLVGLAESLSSAAAGDVTLRSPNPRSPRSFDYDGAVGLSIVAAMNDGIGAGLPEAHPRGAPVTRAPRPAAAATRSVPIPILSPATAGGGRAKKWRDEEEDEMELSESYTCVIAHVGGATVRKRVNFDSGCSVPLFETPPPPARLSLLPPAEDFLSRCFRCRKQLHGIDIFMYRGEKAFCSAECRCQQMVSDECREKYVSDAAKPFDCSVSPCSTPLFFAAGLAAA